MTAYDIYKAASSLLFEAVGSDRAFNAAFIDTLNILLAEATPYENSRRRAEGRALLEEVPAVSQKSDVVPMCDEICRIALPYGVAAQFLQDDGEAYLSSLYRERYVNALSDAREFFFSDISDVYGGEDA